ncbi:MAG: glycoside hydrolase family 2 TIM barrel-domain containing protein [Candidatus Omnitrophota bacterium]
MRKFFSLAALPFSFLLLPFSVYAWGADQQGTEMLNAHGEAMELDFKLYDPGSERVVDYATYGTFEGVGTGEYRYKITDRKGLAAAVGEGIYPNNAVYKDPTYRMLVTKGKLSGSQWDYVNIDDQQLAFYKWAMSHDTMGVQQYYTALSLEKLGESNHAIKAYHALIVHFPKDIGWTVFHTPIYMARLAIDRIEYLTRKYPELGLKLIDAKIQVENGFDFNVSNDRFIVNPGRLVQVKPGELKPKRVSLGRAGIARKIGQRPVQLVEFKNGHWQMRVDGKPFIVKAVAYNPTPVGKSPHEGYNLDSWAVTDLNENGKIDGPFDAWVDKNKNSRQDPDEKAVGDFALMKAMGVNAIRLYHHPMNKELLRQLYKDYGIRVILGDLLGMYAVGSGAEWFKGTDFTDPVQKENMKASVRKLVMEHKDEPYVLMWMLGNESNYGEPGDPAKDKVGFGSQAKLQPEAHYAFVNEVAGMIKSLDPNHLVGYSNGETVTIDILKKSSHNIDIFGVNAYRGSSGFGRSLWEDVREHLGKPVLITEYGCPAHFAGKNLDFAEEKQLEYHRGNWEDILRNKAGSGYGNAIGGVVFEFVDEWWKAGPPPKFSAAGQETIGDFQANFPDGWMYEEWLGVTTQGDGSHSPYMRQLRKTYDYYKKVWNK